MKKIILFIMSFMLITSVSAQEQTLDQLLNSIEKNRKEYQEQQKQKELTEKEKEETIAKKEATEKDIKKIQGEITNRNNNIDNIQKEVDEKNKEMKSIMNFVQVSDGETKYLDYVFGANDFTDFIYRLSVAEQLEDYNDKVVKEYNESVQKLQNEKKYLAEKNEELEKKQKELAEYENKLNQTLSSIKEGMLSKDDEYKVDMEIINNMKKMGCSGSETKSSCQTRLNNELIEKMKREAAIAEEKRKAAQNNSNSTSNNTSTNTQNNTSNNTPSSSSTPHNSSGTYLPISHGYLTSDYGPRSGEYHTGIDFASGTWYEKVYPVAAGKVVALSRLSNGCGNHIVYVYHYINGKAYTTSYWHLLSWNVSVGQYVTADTVIGTIGGRGYTDPCAYGGHIHLNLFNGLTTNNKGRINPHQILPSYTPRQGQYFSHR